MTDHIIGFLRKDGSISYVNYEPDETMHDEQIEEERWRRIDNEIERKYKR